MFKNIISKISESAKDHLGKLSSSRISSYFILGQILLTCMVFVAIDIVNAIMVWYAGDVYEIPYAHIIIFGMVLTHHLFLLGIKKGSEASQFPSLDKLEENLKSKAEKPAK